MAKSALPTCTSVSALPTCSQKPNQIGSMQSKPKRSTSREDAARIPTFTCVTAASLPTVSAASWRSPRHSLLPSRPEAASSLSFAPALPTAAAAFRAAPRRQRLRRARVFSAPPLAPRGSPSRPTSPHASLRQQNYSAAWPPRLRAPAPQLSSVRTLPQLSSARTSPQRS